MWLVVDASVELWAGEPGRRARSTTWSRRSPRWPSRHLRARRPRGARRGGLAAALVDRAGRGRRAGGAHRGRPRERRELHRRGSLRARRARGRPAASPSTRGRSTRAGSRTCARATSTRSPRAPSSSALARPSRRACPSRTTPREQALRHYLAAFGIESPPRVDGEREQGRATLAQVLEKLVAEKPRAEHRARLGARPRRGATASRQGHRGDPARAASSVRWSLPRFEAEHRRRAGASQPRGRGRRRGGARARARRRAARGRARSLRRLGVRAQSPRRRPRLR